MDYSKWMAVISESMTQLTQRVIAYLPNVLSAIVLVGVGWLLAMVLRAFCSRITAAALGRFARNEAVERSLERTGLRRTIPKVVSGTAYWVLLLFFIAAAIERLELTVVTRLLSDFATYLPSVLLAVLVVFVGLIGGNLARHAVSTGAASAGIGYADLLGRIVQATIVLVAVVIGADQVGIQSTFLMLTVAIVVGTAFGGAALAFGLGSGPTVSNIISSYYLHKTYRIGQTVRIGEVQGKIAQISPTAVVLETVDGQALIPAKRFNEEMSTLLPGV